MFTSSDAGFFVPQQVGGSGNMMGENKNKGDDNFAGGHANRRKNRVFAPVTMKMIHEASPRPDDVCEIEGEPINDVRKKPLSSEILLDHHRRPCYSEDGGAYEDSVRDQR